MAELVMASVYDICLLSQPPSTEGCGLEPCQGRPCCVRRGIHRSVSALGRGGGAYQCPRALLRVWHYCSRGCAAISASLAQLAEHALRKRMVVGSIPTGG